VVNFGDMNEFNSKPEVSVSFWFMRQVDKPNNSNHGVSNILFSHGSDPYNDNIEIGTDGANVEIYVDCAHSDQYASSYNAGIQNNIWYHLAFTYNKDDPWGVRLSNLDVKVLDNFSIGLENKEHFLLGYKKSIANTKLDLNLSYSKNKTNPWVNMSGVWGSVDNASTIDSNLTWTNGDFWAQGGVMVTNTNLNTGLVSDIDNLYLVHSTTGWEEDNWRVYVGIKPKLVKGDIEFNLPIDVDISGVMQYNKQKTQVNNDTTSFVGGSWHNDLRGYLLSVDGVVDSSSEHYTSIAINKKF